MPVALTPGMRLGAYEIVALVGAGGMGEVYRARDTRLDRTVAIKVLTSVEGSPERRERFEREARAISSLSHPHICALYDVGEAPNPALPASGDDTVRFLVLEYLEGQTLADRLTGDPLAPAAALRHAIEICGALDKAHRSGIVHRDLKPANVMLTRAGVKLLDFGLAKSTVPAVAAATTMSMPPTSPANLTAQGTILGTLQYMAPEQIEGLEADARSDIFAFGAVLFEMFTSRTAFVGTTRASLLSAILRDEPPSVSRVQPGAPTVLDRIISTRLAKDPDDRYQSARDLLRDLEWVTSGSGDGAAAATVAPLARSSRLAWLVAALSVIALIATAAIAMRRASQVSSSASATRFTIAAPENTSFGGPVVGRGTGSATQVAVSPDGRNIVFVAGTQAAYQIWLRPAATLEAQPIPGTEGGTFPFWSPDSRFIGFFAAGKLKKVSIVGGPPVVLCDAPLAPGGSWSREDVIVFAPGPATPTLFRVSSAGGVPTAVTTLDPATGESGHRWPHFLPDGQHFLYTAVTGICCPPSKPSVIKIGSLDAAGADVTLLQTESSVSYASGHLLFARDGALMAQAFDPDTRALKGDAFPVVAEHIVPEGSRYVSVSVSNNGTLVYAQTEAPAVQQLTWLDRAGRPIGTLGDVASYVSLALSSDEERVAVVIATGSQDNTGIWIIDIKRNIRSRLTPDAGSDTSPVWSPDGTHIAFQASRPGKDISLHQVLTDGTGADELLLDGPGNFTMAPSSWSADGHFILYMTHGSDVWVLPLFGDRKPFPLAQTPFTETSAVFSRDGRWVAYTSNEGGRPNVYVRPFPEASGKLQISRDGGSYPVWRADGKELFYLDAEGTMMAVAIDATSRFDPGVPQPLFSTGTPTADRRQGLGSVGVYAVTRDGQRFLVGAASRQSRVAPLTVLLNWMSAIKKEQ